MLNLSPYTGVYELSNYILGELKDKYQVPPARYQGSVLHQAITTNFEQTYLCFPSLH